MPREAEPWKWEDRNGWYGWVRGRRLRLCSLKESKQTANKRLYELLAEADSGDDAPVDARTVGDLMAAYLEEMVRRRRDREIGSQTKADALRRMAGFGEMHGDMPVAAIKPHHVTAWLDTRKEWNATSRHDGVGAVKGVFRWALKTGRIERDPLASMSKPQRKAKRSKIPTAQDVELAFTGIKCAELRELLTFIGEVGCRPKEARTIEAKHIDREAGRVVLAEHKTARKTGKDRILYLSPTAAEIAYRLADARPEGPIFRNSSGNPWTSNALGLAMRRLRKRVGLGRDMVPYALRHRFATDALSKLPPAIVAELMGHTDLRMLSKYSHLSDRHDVLRDAVAKVRDKEPDAS